MATTDSPLPRTTQPTTEAPNSCINEEYVVENPTQAHVDSNEQTSSSSNSSTKVPPEIETKEPLVQSPEVVDNMKSEIGQTTTPVTTIQVSSDTKTESLATAMVDSMTGASSCDQHDSTKATEKTVVDAEKASEPITATTLTSNTDVANAVPEKTITATKTKALKPDDMMVGEDGKTLTGVKKIVREINEKAEAEQEALKLAGRSPLPKSSPSIVTSSPDVVRAKESELEQRSVDVPVTPVKTVAIEPATKPVADKASTKESMGPATKPIAEKASTKEPVEPAVAVKSSTSKPAAPTVGVKTITSEPTTPAGYVKTIPSKPTASAVELKTSPSKPTEAAVVVKASTRKPAVPAAVDLKTSPSKSTEAAVVLKASTRKPAVPAVAVKANEPVDSAVPVKTSGKETMEAPEPIFGVIASGDEASPSGLTMQKPFRLLSLARHEQAKKEREERERRRKQREKDDYKPFKARPMPDFNR